MIHKILIGIMLFSFILGCATSNPNSLSKMKKKDRNEYLISLSREVIKNFGPGYLRDYKKPIISKVKKYGKQDDLRPEIQKNVGRKYYTVTFLYDPTKEQLEWDYAAKVYIWQDTGEPKGAFFGNGIGPSFTFKPYKEQILGPIEIYPYRQYQEPESPWGD